MMAKTDEEKEHHALVANTRELLKGRAGQDLVWFVLDICNLHVGSFTGNSTTFYNEGRRSVGLDILELLQDVGPTAYAQLLLEKTKAEEDNG
jgi:hypothetical protein